MFEDADKAFKQENILSDGSKTYDVVLIDSGEEIRMVIPCSGESSADLLLKTLDVETLVRVVEAF